MIIRLFFFLYQRLKVYALGGVPALLTLGPGVCDGAPVPAFFFFSLGRKIYKKIKLINL